MTYSLLNGACLFRQRYFQCPQQLAGTGKDPVGGKFDIILTINEVDSCLKNLVFLVQKIDQGALTKVELLAVGQQCCLTCFSVYLEILKLCKGCSVGIPGELHAFDNLAAGTVPDFPGFLYLENGLFATCHVLAAG